MSSSSTAALAADGGAMPKAGLMQGALSLLLCCLPLVAFMSLPPAMPKLVAHFAGVKGVTVLTPLLATAPALCVAILAPLAGWLADRIGRRKLALGATALFALASVVPLLVDDLWLILFGRLVMGVANSALITIGITLIGDYFDGPVRSKWLAANSVVGSLLISAASLSGGVLAGYSWRGPFLINLMALPVLALCFVWLFEPPILRAATQSDAPQETAAFPWRSLAGLALVTLVCAVLFYAEAVQIGLVMDQIGVKAPGVIALASSGASLGYPLGAWVYSKIVQVWSGPTRLCVGWGLFGFGLIGLGAIPDPLLAGLSGFIQQLGAGIVLTGLVNQCYERFPIQIRALSAGVWMSAFFFGQFASPLVVAAISGGVGGLRPAIAVLGAPPLIFALLALVKRAPAPAIPAAVDLA